MKIYLLSLTLLLCALAAQAQSFNFYPAQHLTDTVEANGTSTQNMKVVPSDSMDIQVKWVVLSNTLDTGWSVSLCDYPACYFDIPDSGTMDPITTSQIQSGLTPFFQLLIGTNESVGEAELVIYAYNVNNPSMGDTVSFVVVNTEALEDTTDITGVATHIGASPVNVFPNPAEHVVSVTGAALDEVQLFSVSGALIRTQKANGKSRVQLDVSDLPIGLYMVVTRSGEEVTWTKLLKQ